MAFIRPSSLQLAEKCQRSPWLANRYPEENDNTRHGSAVDADISAALQDGETPKTKEGLLLLDWIRGRFTEDAQYFVQRKVSLFDPVSGELITEGTPDLLVVDGKRLYIVDWKTKGQMFAGHLKRPDDNLQQQAYLVAAGMEIGSEEGQIILACFDEKSVIAIEGAVLPGEAWWPLLDRIKAVPPVDFDGPEPMAIKGEHCDGCYQKQHCSAYLLPAMREMPEALVPFSESRAVALTLDQAKEGLAWLAQAEEAISRAKKVKEVVQGQLETFVTAAGPIEHEGMVWGPIPTTGKRSGPTLTELEDLGLTNLIRSGKPGVKYDWKKKVA